MGDVKALDKAVAEATELRQNENADYKKLMSDDTTAKELLNFAKNRLNKFYNPKLYKPPPKRELTAEERITVNLGGTVATPAPGGIAETGNGVISMIDLLIADLDKEMQEASVDEKNSQEEYETMMAESAAKRAADSKSITDM